MNTSQQTPSKEVFSTTRTQSPGPAVIPLAAGPPHPKGNTGTDQGHPRTSTSNPEEQYMIRTTYRGRAIKVLAARGKPFHRKMVINDRTINHGWQGDDVQALNWFKQIIDQMDAAGGPGNSAERLHYTAPHWWEPGTFDVNPNGDATQPGGVCLCGRCVIPEVGGGKARFAPLHPDACQHCHQLADGHDDDVHLEWHRYTEPTAVQRAGRQATIDEYQRDVDEDDDPSEATCDAIYPEQPSGYLSRPRCLYFADHRDAHDPDFHYDVRGFRWIRKAAR